MGRQDPEFNFDSDILDIIPERYDSDADSTSARSSARRSLVINIALGTVALIGVGVVAMYFLNGDQGNSSVGGIPVIKADDNSYKQRPDERGGMDVPNRDKRVYDRMGASTATEPQVERLLPPPEAPQSPPVIEPPPIPGAEKAAPSAVVAVPPAPMAPPAPPTPAPVAAKAAPVPVPAPAPVVTKPAPAPVAAKPAPAPDGTHVVQLAALRGEADAVRAWDRIAKAQPDLLGSLQPDVQRADLGAKGIFYRLRTNAMDENSARMLCAELSKRKVGCLVAKR